MPDQNLTKKSEFISVEIAIKTDFDSDAFVKWFEDQDNCVNKYSCDTHKWYIYFDPIPGKDADTTIKHLCEMIHALPPEVRKAWDDAAHREFFAGYHVGDEPFCFTEHLEVETLKAAVELDAGIGFALYPASLSDEDGLPEDIPGS